MQQSLSWEGLCCVLNLNNVGNQCPGNPLYWYNCTSRHIILINFILDISGFVYTNNAIM